MGVKKMSELILFCYFLGLEKVGVDIYINEVCEVVIVCIVCFSGKIGVEMEVFMGVSVVVLMIYDMCKVFSYDIMIKEICLLEKIGGKLDYYKGQDGKEVLEIC